MKCIVCMSLILCLLLQDKILIFNNTAPISSVARQSSFICLPVPVDGLELKTILKSSHQISAIGYSYKQRWILKLVCYILEFILKQNDEAFADSEGEMF